MGFVSLANIITSEFNDLATVQGWAVRYSNDPRPNPTTGFWMVVSVDFGDATQIELGINSYRDVGNLTVMIKNNAKLGIGASLAAADTIAENFRSVTIDSVVLFRTPHIVKVGRIEDVYQIDVICPFQYDFSS